MPYLMRKKPKATTKPWFSRLLRHPARKRSGSILGHKTHPGPTRGTLCLRDPYKLWNYVTTAGVITGDM